MDQAFISKLTETIEANLRDEKFGIIELSRVMGMSRSGIYRKLKKITKKSLNQVIREYRLSKAMEMLQHHEATIAEIAYEVGFGSPAYFTKCFHEYYGYPPGEVKKVDHPDQVKTANSFRQFLLADKSGPRNSKSWRDLLKSRNSRILSFVLLSFLVAFGIIGVPGIRLLNRSNRAANGGVIKPDRSIAVLPFKNLSEEPEIQYFADGIMEDILDDLFQIRDIRVISRTTMEHFRESTLTSPEIARKLKVGYILEGSVQRAGAETRIHVQLIDVKRDQHIWSEKYDRKMDNVFSIQSDIAKQIARELRAVLLPEELKQIEKIPTRNTEAYEMYLRGRFFCNSRTDVGLKKGLGYYENALRKDPDYALAYSGMADAYFLLAFWGYIQRAEGYSRAKECAFQALKIDNNLAQAHAAMGCVLTWGEWNWEDAIDEFKIALKLNPNYNLAHNYYSELLDILRENSKAREQINLALELDPYNWMSHLLSAAYYCHEGKFGMAEEECNQVIEINNEYKHIHYRLFNMYYRQHEDMLVLKKIQDILMTDTATVAYANSVTQAYDQSGIRGVLQLLIESQVKISRPNYYWIASWYALLGDKERSLHYLDLVRQKHLAQSPEITYTSDELPHINNNLDFENLSNEPGFQALLQEMGLSGYH